MTEETKRRKVAKRAYYFANKDKILSQQKAYVQANKEKVKAGKKASALKNIEKKRAKNRAYNLTHKEEVRARSKIWYFANIEKAKANRRAHYLANKEENKIKRREYYKKHPDKCRKFWRKRRAIKRGNAHEPYTDTYIFERDGWICQLCGQKINKRLKWPNPRSKSIDHIIPYSKGGDDAPINVQATHLRCNLSKQARGGGQLRLIS